MKRSAAPLLAAPLFLLTSTGCRDLTIGYTYPHDLAGTAQDLSVPKAPDLATPPDLDTSLFDLTPPPPPTEFVVVRVGDGNTALTSDAFPAFLERRKISDGSLVGTPLALPTAVSGANKRLTLAGTATAEGALSLSGDWRYLVIGGYDADAGTKAVASTASATVNRVIGLVSSTNAIDTSTAADFFSATGVRGATSSDGKALWASASAGTVYTTAGSTAMPTSLNATNTRWPSVFNGQLYATSGSGSNKGVNSVGTGLPKTSSAATLLSGFETQTTTSHYGLVAFDRDAQPGLDVIYVADDNMTGGGVQRWSLSGGKWKLDGTMSKGLTAGARGLAGYIDGTKVVVVATTAETVTRVVSFTDDGTALDMITAQELAKAGTNTVYRGIAFPPQ